MALFLIIESRHLLLIYPDVCAARIMYTSVLATVIISDGRVVRTTAFGAADPGVIPSRVKPMTLKLVFTAFLLDAQH